MLKNIKICNEYEYSRSLIKVNKKKYDNENKRKKWDKKDNVCSVFIISSM